MNRRELLIKTGTGLLALSQINAIGPASAATPGAALNADGLLEIDVKRRAGHDYPIFDLQARAAVRATLQQSWEVLTDYDREADFVPNLISSRLIARDDRTCVIEQEGYGQFLFIKQAIHLLVRAQETPFSNIAVTLVKGNMHEYRANWALSTLPEPADAAPDSSRTQIIYTATIAPTFYIPSLFGAALMKRDLHNMIAAVVREIEKPS
ncbi:MAG: polyketide cyclase [Mucilaginibacter sp.]|nr:polyketide cyclase [Mucilaginibacter sp.]